VTVAVNGKAYKTDNKGKLQVPNLAYGDVTITAKKAGYKDVNYGAKLDFDPFFHKFGGQSQDAAVRSVELSMTATGIPVSFKVVDWLSGKPITTGEFSVADIVAKPDDQGVVTFKIPGTDASKATIHSSFGGTYTDKKFDVTLGDKSVPAITFVPGGKDYFVSKRSGVLSVYSSNLDGSNIETVVTGNGQETESTAFTVSPNGKYGILVSSRDGARNAKKNILQRVYVVDLTTKALRQVDEGLMVKFADWSGNTLVYTTTNFDTNGNTNQVTLRSVDTSNNRVYSFESADEINVSNVGFDKIIYQKVSLSPPASDDSPLLRVATINATSIKTLGTEVDEVNYLQLDFDRIAFQTTQDQSWHEYNLNTDQLKTVSQPSSDDNTIQFVATPDQSGSRRLMVQRIDGKYVLIAKDTATGAQKKLYSAGGLSGPVRWVGDAVIYRVATGKETADYVISLDGGEAKKIADVTAQAGSQEEDFGQRFSLY
jgi:hypothetical protein